MSFVRRLIVRLGYKYRGDPLKGDTKEHTKEHEKKLNLS